MNRASPSHYSLWVALLFFVLANVWFSLNTRDLRPVIDEMPAPPSDGALKAMALGDNEFLFRHLGRWLEYVGDGGGRVRPLREYDYERVVGWLETLDDFDHDRSDYVHVLAAKYFGQVTIDPTRVRKIIQYLRLVGIKDPAHRWQWLVWCADTARRPLKDKALALGLAHDFDSPELKSPNVPPWVRLMGVRLLLYAGEKDAAKEAYNRVDPADIADVEESIRRLQELVRRNGAKAGAENLENSAPLSGH